MFGEIFGQPRNRGNPGEIGPDEPMDSSQSTEMRPLGESARFRRHHFKISGILRDFDVDDFGIPRAPAAQILAYGTGILRIVEPLFPLMISRPYAISPGVPAGDLCIRSGSKCDAIRHEHSFPPVLSPPSNTASSQKSALDPIGAKKRHRAIS